MGNYIGTIEGLDTKQIDSAQQKFNKSKDFLRVYVVNAGEMKKVLSVKAIKNEGHSLKTEVEKQVSKKADSVIVLSKNISFYISIVYTDRSGNDVIFDKVVYSSTSKSVNESLNESIEIEGVSRFRGVSLFAPSHLKENYKTYPDDMLEQIKKKSNWINVQGLKMKNEVIKMRKRRKEDKKKKNENGKSESIVEGFQSNILWGLDGRVHQIEVDPDYAFSPAM